MLALPPASAPMVPSPSSSPQAQHRQGYLLNYEASLTKQTATLTRITPEEGGHGPLERWIAIVNARLVRNRSEKAHFGSFPLAPTNQQEGAPPPARLKQATINALLAGTLPASEEVPWLLWIRKVLMPQWVFAQSPNLHAVVHFDARSTQVPARIQASPSYGYIEHHLGVYQGPFTEQAN
jgi:hypothetical protein